MMTGALIEPNLDIKAATQGLKVPCLRDLCLSSFLDKISYTTTKESFLANAKIASQIQDHLQQAQTVEKLLRLSTFLQNIHPSLHPCHINSIMSMTASNYAQWEVDLQDMNVLRTVKPNTVGRVQLVTHTWASPFTVQAEEKTIAHQRLSNDEYDAAVSGKLMGITRFEKLKEAEELWHLRMDSFVHPCVWFEIDYDAKSKTFRAAFDKKCERYKLAGRMSVNGASDLRIVQLSDALLRVDDVLNLAVWAEISIPSDVRKQKTGQKRKKRTCSSAWVETSIPSDIRKQKTGQKQKKRACSFVQ